jgi:glycosyltransferase involved in cell wall biosynthesis
MPEFLGPKYFSLFDCVEYFSSINPKIDKIIKKKTDLLIKNSHLFFVNSATLAKVFSKYKPILIPQGFDLVTFENNVKTKIKIHLPAGKPIIGYTGSINYRLDYELLNKVVKTHPNWNFVFIGSKQANSIEDNLLQTEFWQRKLFENPNVFVFKNQPKKNLPAIISHFNICLIPYISNIKFNKYCFPMKIFEYFYMGKPVVSTPIEELVQFKPYVKIISSAKDMSNAIEKLILPTTWPKSYYKAEKKLAIQNSWYIKISNILENMESEII